MGAVNRGFKIMIDKAFKLCCVMYLKVKMQSAAKLKNPSEVSCVNQRLAAVVYIVNTIVLFCNGILQIKGFANHGCYAHNNEVCT